MVLEVILMAGYEGRRGLRVSSAARVVGLGLSVALSLGGIVALPRVARAETVPPAEERVVSAHDGVATATGEKTAQATEQASSMGHADATGQAGDAGLDSARRKGPGGSGGVASAGASAKGEGGDSSAATSATSTDEPAAHGARATDVARDKPVTSATRTGEPAAACATSATDEPEHTDTKPSAGMGGEGVATHAASPASGVEPASGATTTTPSTQVPSSATKPLPSTKPKPATDDTSTAPTTYANVYRLFNQWTTEHLYTRDLHEAQGLMRLGWSWEGVSWVTPSAGTSVYRLYNKWSGDHLYTTKRSEYDGLVKRGWTGEDVQFYGEAPKNGVSIYRLFNKYVTTGTHLLTSSTSEVKACVGNGWRDEGTAWYAAKHDPFSIAGFWVECVDGRRLWVDATCALASGRIVDPMTSRDRGAGRYAYARRDGAVVTELADAGNGWSYLADSMGGLVHRAGSGWVVTKDWPRSDARLQRYYTKDMGGYSLVRRGVFSAKDDLGELASYLGRTDTGYVLRGILSAGGDWSYLADDDGRLVHRAGSGWVVTKDWPYSDGQLQRYWTEDKGAYSLVRNGLFSTGGKRYYGRYDTGYVVRGTYVISRYYGLDTSGAGNDWKDDTVAIADNDGVLLTREQVGQRLLASARSQVGCDYTTDDSAYYPGRAFNCSGLSWWVFNDALGVNLSHNQGYYSYYARQTNKEDSQVYGVLKRNGWKTAIHSLQIGDLVFFSPIGKRLHTGHVGIYVGDGTMIDANTTGVKYRRVLKKSYVGGGFPITLV